MASIGSVCELVSELLPEPAKFVLHCAAVLVGGGDEGQADTRGAETAAAIRRIDAKTDELNKALDEIRGNQESERESHYRAAILSINLAKRVNAESKRARIDDAIHELTLAASRAKAPVEQAAIYAALGGCLDLQRSRAAAREQFEQAYSILTSQPSIRLLSAACRRGIAPGSIPADSREVFLTTYQAAGETIQLLKALASMLASRRSRLDTTIVDQIENLHERLVRMVGAPALPRSSTGFHLAELSRWMGERDEFLHPIPVIPSSAGAAREEALRLARQAAASGGHWWQNAKTSDRRITEMTGYLEFTLKVERSRQSGGGTRVHKYRSLIFYDDAPKDKVGRFVLYILHEDGGGFYAEAKRLPTTPAGGDLFLTSSMAKQRFQPPDLSHPNYYRERVPLLSTPRSSALAAAQIADRVFVDCLGAAPDYQLGTKQMP